VRRRLRALLPRLHLLPPLTEQLDQWAEWLVRTRFAGRSPAEIDKALAELAEFRDTVLDNARITPGETAVDAGTGTGLVALGAVERVGPDGDVIAVDISVDCLEQLRAIATAPNMSFLIGSADVLPLPDATADVVLTRSVLIYVRDKAAAAREFFRVLRSGGRVSAFEPINRRRRRISEVVDFEELRPLIERWEADVDAGDDPMLDFDERDLAGSFEAAGFRDLVLDFRPGETEIAAERWLTTVGAPGRKPVLEVWGERFSPEEVDRLAGIVRAQKALDLAWPQLYLTAVKP
jgi:arsenite methyltransferase